MKHLHNQTIENEEIYLGNDDVYYLGPNLQLKNCRLAIRTSARALTINDVEIEDCEISALQTLREFRWYYAWLRRCRFSGKFSGCDFGRWTENNPSYGGIELCDFSNTRLHGCRFLDIKASTITYPTWPCFTFIDPINILPELKLKNWPGNTGIIIKTFATFPLNVASVSYDASEIIKKFGSSIDELHSFLEQINSVIL